MPGRGVTELVGVLNVFRSTNASEVDEEHFRDRRRARLFAAMIRHELDAVVLGRPAEVAFATGARQLWTAGSRPFGPAAVAVLSTGRIHLLSVSDFDVPEEVGHDDLYGLHWNPANLAAELAAIPGLREAKRVGTTSSSPGFGRLIGALAPDAEQVDAAPAVWEARLPKGSEVGRIHAAAVIATIGMRAMEAALRPGGTERELRAVCLEAIAAAGAPTAPTEGVACATAMTGPVHLRRLDSTEAIQAGQLVVLDPGGFFRGYEGGVGRTRVVGGPPTEAQQELLARALAGRRALIDACRPGATGADVVAAWKATGEAVPPFPLVTGMGLGLEPPVIDEVLGHREVLQERTVLSVASWVTEEGVGGVLLRDLVLIQEDRDPIIPTDHITTDLEVPRD
jgi:Xaa-Pro aminopeptidase